jgi:hypothetical protein
MAYSFFKTDIVNIHTDEIVGQSITILDTDTKETRDCGRYPDTHEIYHHDRNVAADDIIDEETKKGLIKSLSSPKVGQFTDQWWW